MAQYNVNLSVLLDAQNPDEVMRKLSVLLANHKWELGVVECLGDKQVKPAETPVPQHIDVADNNKENVITYRVADEKFSVFAKDFGFSGTELLVPKNKDFLQFRVKAFLEGLGYKVEGKRDLRIVAESHTESIPAEDDATVGPVIDTNAVRVKEV